MAYILRNCGSFLKIPVASNTVNSLLLRRLGKKRQSFITNRQEGIKFYFS